MDTRVRLLIVDGSSEDKRRERSLRKNIERIRLTAVRLGADVHVVRLCKQPFDLGRSASRGSKYIPDALLPLKKEVEEAEVLVCTSAIQWIGSALWFKYFLDQVLSPMEEGGLEDGFENYGKVALISLICDDDGGAALASQMMHTLNHMGFDIPAWGSQYMNIKIPRGKTENNWQRHPEMMVPRALWLAEILREAPTYQRMVLQAESVGLPKP
ncbi:MAG: NAD(P)H-dependent oxidoreductase [Candidatus Pacebacteria bacterium]|nr:NAD(P)H-dependent oxidoreductase [Candidatus Paceibacterota bacterium]